MKKYLIGLWAFIAIMSCAKTEEGAGYIGPSEPAIENGVMTPEVLLSLGRLSDPQLSPDGSRILYGVSWTDIAANRSCRNLWICNMDGSGNVQLTRYAKSVSNARWSADGKSIFFLQGGQLWKAPLNGNKLGKKVQLSDVPAGIGEFKLSPDQKSVIYLSTIKNGKLQQPSDSDPALDKAQAYATEDLMYRHWDHWVTEVPRSYVARLDGKITPENSTDILGDEPWELPTEPFGGAEQLDWSPDGRYIAYSCRKLSGASYEDELIVSESFGVNENGTGETDAVYAHRRSTIVWAYDHAAVVQFDSNGGSFSHQRDEYRPVRPERHGSKEEGGYLSHISFLKCLGGIDCVGARRDGLHDACGLCVQSA